MKPAKNIKLNGIQYVLAGSQDVDPLLKESLELLLRAWDDLAHKLPDEEELSPNVARRVKEIGDTVHNGIELLNELEHKQRDSEGYQWSRSVKNPFD